MIKYLAPAILIILITFMMLYKWPTIDDKYKKKISVTLLLSTILMIIALIVLLVD